MKQLAMYINGAFVSDFAGSYRDVLNPATEAVIAQQVGCVPPARTRWLGMVETVCAAQAGVV